MNNFQDILNNKDLKNRIFSFLSQYGLNGLEEALNAYEDMQQIYLIKTKTSVSKIRLCEIDYIEIRGHHMTIHTPRGTYPKYGSLSQELKFLASYGFIKCNQNCIVSLHKINDIIQDEIILTDGTKIHMSRNCTPKVLMSFHRQIFSRQEQSGQVRFKLPESLIL